MKRPLSLLLLCSFLLLASCVGQEDPPLAFAWTQAYLASPVGEEQRLSLTFFGKKNSLPFSLSDVVNISPEGISQERISFQYELTPLGIDEEDGYLAYSVQFTYTPKETGLFETPSLAFSLSNGDTLSFPVGQLVFDIDGADSGLVDTWESIVAVSTTDSLPYTYLLTDDRAVIRAIQFGAQSTISQETGLEPTGTIPLDEDYSAPLVIVRTKLKVDLEGEPALSYGKGCYCGGTSAQGSTLRQSLDHWAAEE